MLGTDEHAPAAALCAAAALLSGQESCKCFSSNLSEPATGGMWVGPGSQSQLELLGPVHAPGCTHVHRLMRHHSQRTPPIAVGATARGPAVLACSGSRPFMNSRQTAGSHGRHTAPGGPQRRGATPRISTANPAQRRGPRHSSQADQAREVLGVTAAQTTHSSSPDTLPHLRQTTSCLVEQALGRAQGIARQICCMLRTLVSAASGELRAAPACSAVAGYARVVT
jgi:hypothetical protein